MFGFFVETVANEKKACRIKKMTGKEGVRERFKEFRERIMGEVSYASY